MKNRKLHYVDPNNNNWTICGFYYGGGTGNPTLASNSKYLADCKICQRILNKKMKS